MVFINKNYAASSLSVMILRCATTTDNCHDFEFLLDENRCYGSEKKHQ